MELAEIAAALGGTLVRERPLSGGISATVTALTLALPDGGELTVVVRQPREAQDLDTEVRLLHALDPLGVPVARPLAHGACWVATTLVEGEVDLGPANLDAFARQLAAIHRVPLAGLPPLPVRRLTLEPSMLDAQRAIERALTALRVPAATPTLLHGDYWPGNLIWWGERVGAVLDWEMAARGDPLSDVATARLELLWSRGHRAMDAFTRAYGPAADPALAAWDLWVAHRKLRRLPHWGLSNAEFTRMAALLDGFWRDALGRLMAPVDLRRN